jgi:hypothetical protein
VLITISSTKVKYSSVFPTKIAKINRTQVPSIAEMMLTLFFKGAQSTCTVFTIRSIPMQRYQHQEATVNLHHHMEHMNDDKEDEEDDEYCTEDEEDDDLLDELVVAAIRSSCIK